MDDSASDILAQLRREFIEQLPARMEAILEQFEPVCVGQESESENVQNLHRLLHSLTGSAGTYGLMTLSVVARDAESLLFNRIKAKEAIGEADLASIANMLDRLQTQIGIAKNADASSLLPPRKPVYSRQSPLIHIVEDDKEQANHLCQSLRNEDFEVEIFNTPAEFRAAYAKKDSKEPDAVIMDLVFPEGEDAGAELITELGLVDNSSIPVLVGSVRDDLQARLAAFRAGAVRYLNKPYNTSQIVDILDALTGRQPPEPYRVLLVDDDPQLLEAEATILRAAGIKVLGISEPLKTLDAAEDFDPDVIVLDVYMPDATGPELAAVLRERDSHLHTPILFLSSETDMSQQLLALSLGGDDFLVKPIQPDHFISAVSARARRVRQNQAIQKRLETTLYEREREHAAVNRHAIVSIADASGNIIGVNDQFCRISGYSRDDLLGKNHRIVKSNVHPQEFYDNLWQTISSGYTWHGDICNKRRDGSLYWVASTITPFLDSEGIPYQYVSIRTDITGVKEHEVALQTLVESTASVTGESFFQKAVEGLASATDVQRAFIAQLDPKEDDLLQTIAYWDTSKLLDNFSFPVTGTPCENMLQEQNIAVIPEDLTKQYPDFNLHKHSSMDNFVGDITEKLAEKFPGFTILSVSNIESFIGVPLTASDGKVLGYMGIMDSKPMTETKNRIALLRLFASRIESEIERQLGQQAVEQTKERLRRGQLYANIGTWEWDIQSGDLYWSERIAPLFGYVDGEVETTYANFLAAVHPDDREAVSNAVNATVSGDAPYEIEHRVIWRDGTVRWLLERGAVVRDEHGVPMQMLGVVQDIHDRKSAELALRESQAKLSGLYALSPLGIALTDMDGQFLEFNEAFRDITGYSGDELKTLDYWALTPREFEEQEMQQLAQLAQDGRYGPYEKMYRCKDGEMIPVRLNGILIRDEDGHRHIWSIVENITDSKNAEQALIAARDEAERANKAKSEFLSSMSHELRTPMNAILGFGQILEYDEEMSAENKDSVKEIIKAGQHLLELINEVLDLAKVESGYIDLSLEPVSLEAVIDDCLSLIRTLADKRDISIHLEAGDGIVIRTDRVRFKQALLNLLSNAIKYNREGGKVTLDCYSAGNDFIGISVIDTGLGIAPDKMKELFQPFNRLDAENSEVEGTGIGLTLTRSIVEMMGGRVFVQSEVGVGSTFSIEMPLESMTAEAAKQHAERAGSETADLTITKEDQATPVTLLYIEDNPANLKLVSHILGQRKQIRLITAHTAQLGLDLATSCKPDLILLDINLPGMDGYQVLELLKADQALQDVPVIALTANAMPLDVEKGKQAGFTEYLTKPLDVQNFLHIIDQYLLSDEAIPYE